MTRYLAIILATLSIGATSPAEEIRPVLLENANVLPLALSDEFEFRKSIEETFTEDTQYETGLIPSRMLEFKRESKLRGTIGRLEERERYGQYFTFFWRTATPSDVTVRLEYRQDTLGAYVQAREIFYENVSGSVKTDFQITGDDYLVDGRVTSWRALLIKDGAIVAMKTSLLWD